MSSTKRPSTKALEKKAAHIAATMQADPTGDQVKVAQDAGPPTIDQQQVYGV